MKTTEGIKPDIYYSPREISKKKCIANSRGGIESGNYDYILRLIRFGALPAKNFGLGKTPYYRVKGIDLINYLKKS